jgi:hypothetical protein
VWRDARGGGAVLAILKPEHVGKRDFYCLSSFRMHKMRVKWALNAGFPQQRGIR